MSEKIDKFIVAVSGGVDSVVLLDMLANSKLKISNNKSQISNSTQKPISKIDQDIDSHLRGNDDGVEFVVAHFDHGIRDDSGEDAKFVEGLAKKYGLQFELGHGKLGVDASEADAREMRYNFLRQCCRKYKALAIVTAHHQDDLIETAAINLLRGTGWRGLAPMTQAPNSKSQIANNYQLPITNYLVLRPLLSTNKQELVNYANEHQLAWREDSTNKNKDYLRNYVRLTLLPAALKADRSFNEKILTLIEKTRKMRFQITDGISELISTYQLPDSTYQLPRYQLIMWPGLVANEVIYSVLVSLDPDWHPQKVQVERVFHFVKTAKPGKQLQVSKQLLVEVSQDLASFQFKP